MSVTADRRELVAGSILLPAEEARIIRVILAALMVVTIAVETAEAQLIDKTALTLDGAMQIASAAGGISVIAPDGTLLGTIEIGRPTSNVAWGEDGSTLFITGGSPVYRLRLTTTGTAY